MMAGHGMWRWLARAWVALFLSLTVALPVASVLARSTAVGSLISQFVMAVVRFTLWQASLSAAISIALGLPLGLLVSRAAATSPSLRPVLRTLLIVPFTVPTLVAAAAWIALLGRGGLLAPWLGSLAYSVWAVILAHVFLNAPWIALLVSEARLEVPESEIEAAATLGARRVDVLKNLIWPRLRTAVLTASAQVFGLCATSFVLVLILGGGPPVETLETGIYARVRYGDLDLASGAALAIWQALITLVPWALVLILRRRAGPALAVARARHEPTSRKALPLLALCAVAAFSMPYLKPLSELGGGDFWNSEVSQLLAPALTLSVRLAVATALLSVGTALCALVAMPRSAGARAVLALLVSLPAGFSAIVLGLGFLLAYGGLIDPVQGSLPAIVALQAALLLPLAFRSLWPVFEARPLRAIEAAETLGASPSQILRWIEWPRWRTPIASVFALIAGLAVGEVAAASLLVGADRVPLPVLVAQWMGQYRFAEAQAGAALILAVSAVIVASTVGRSAR